MSIKSDVWIKRMCREHRLIEPYEEKLVRSVSDRRIISSGLSSYGYDCRLARDEFKVFSPVTGTGRTMWPAEHEPNTDALREPTGKGRGDCRCDQVHGQHQAG